LLAPRSSLVPGQVFGVDSRVLGPRHGVRDAMIVLDAKSELGFWTGRTFLYGDAAPNMLVELL